MIHAHPGFLPPESGGILAAPRFSGADFTEDGYETLKFEFEVERLEKFSADAELSGDQEVLDPVDTDASGRARFKVNARREVIRYSLVVRNISEVTAAHIHLGPAGVNGGVAAFLFDSGDNPEDGPLRVKGTITPDDIVAGTFIGLVEAILNDGAYVNVHTTANPGGEVRGQIEADF